MHIEKTAGDDFSELMSATLQRFASFNDCDELEYAQAPRGSLEYTGTSLIRHALHGDDYTHRIESQAGVLQGDLKMI